MRDLAGWYGEGGLVRPCKSGDADGVGGIRARSLSSFDTCRRWEGEIVRVEMHLAIVR